MCAALFMWGCADPPPVAQSPALRAAFEALAATAAPTALDPASLVDDAGFQRALLAPFAPRISALGGRAYTLALRARTLDDADVVQGRLLERQALVVDRRGAVALAAQVDWDLGVDGSGSAGRRCWWVDGRWFLGAEVGPVEEVVAEAQEPLACVEAPVETVRAILTRLAIGPEAPLLRGEARRVEVAGRAALAVPLTRRAAPQPAPPTLEATAGERSRPLHPYEALSLDFTRLDAGAGEVVFDAETGLLLRASLSLRLGFRKLSRVGTLELALRLDTRREDGPVLAPAARIAEARPRLLQETAVVLGAEVAAGPRASALASAGPASEPVDLPVPGGAPALELAEVAEGTLPELPTEGWLAPARGEADPDVVAPTLPPIPADLMGPEDAPDAPTPAPTRRARPLPDLGGAPALDPSDLGLPEPPSRPDPPRPPDLGPAQARPAADATRPMTPPAPPDAAPLARRAPPVDLGPVEPGAQPGQDRVDAGAGETPSAVGPDLDEDAP